MPEGEAETPASSGRKCLESSLATFAGTVSPKNRGRREGTNVICPCLSIYMTARENRGLSLLSLLPQFTYSFMMDAGGRHLLQKWKRY